MLPFQPESNQEISARFDEALEHVYSVIEAVEKRPSANRKHVFDTKEGFRFIVTNENHPDDGKVYLHVSMSGDPAHLKKESIDEFRRAQKKGLSGLLKFLQKRVQRFTEYDVIPAVLSNGKHFCHYRFQSGVVHAFFEALGVTEVQSGSTENLVDGAGSVGRTGVFSIS